MPRATILDQPDTRRYLDEPGDGDEDVESGTIDGGHEKAPAEFGDPAAMLLTGGEFEQEEDGAAGEAPPRVLFSRTVCKKGQEKSLGEGEGDGSGAGRRKKKSARKRKPAEAVVPDCDVGHETYYQDRPASTYDGGGGSGWEKERAGKKPKKNIISLCRLCSNAMAEEGMLDSPDELLTEIIILPDERCNECACQDDCESRKK